MCLKFSSSVYHFKNTHVKCVVKGYKENIFLVLLSGYYIQTKIRDKFHCIHDNLAAVLISKLTDMAVSSYN